MVNGVNGIVSNLEKRMENKYTEEDILAAAQYGFNYALTSQNDGKEIPKGNVLQWLRWYETYSIPVERTLVVTIEHKVKLLKDYFMLNVQIQLYFSMKLISCRVVMRVKSMEY